MKVVLLQTAHSAQDDRAYYHQHLTLCSAGHASFIVSTLGLTGYKKYHVCHQALQQHHPDIAICDTPFAVLVAVLHRVPKVVYDVTEWYHPSFIHRLAGRLCDAFIFGEQGKMRPFRSMLSKPHCLLPYYPKSSYIPYYPSDFISDRPLRLLYAGRATEERGILHVLQAVYPIRQRLSPRQVELTIISNDPPVQQPSEMNIHWKKNMPFQAFCEELHKYDLCFDLRNVDAETTHSLPIKLFYYMAAGKPMVYTNMQSIGLEIKDRVSFLYTTDPADSEAIADYVSSLVQDKEKYRRACEEARKYYLTHFQWKKIESRFLDFVADLI